MGKRIVLDLTWLIGHQLKPSHLQTVFSDTFYNGYDTCCVCIKGGTNKCSSSILNLYNIELSRIELCKYIFNGYICVSTGLIYTIYIEFSFYTITTISDTVDFVLGETCYRFIPKRNDKYDLLKIEKPKERFTIENLWK